MLGTQMDPLTKEALLWNQSQVVTALCDMQLLYLPFFIIIQLIFNTKFYTICTSLSKGSGYKSTYPVRTLVLFSI